MRAEPRPLDIFGLADSFRRKIVGRILDDKRFAGAKFGDKPSELRRKRTQRRGVHAFYGCRRDDYKRAVVLKFRKGAAVESEKLPEDELRQLDFGLDTVGRDVGHSRREIGEHAFECQKFFDGRAAGSRIRCSPFRPI